MLEAAASNGNRSSRCAWIDPAETKLSKTKLIDEDIDHPNRIVSPNPVFQALR